MDNPKLTNQANANLLSQPLAILEAVICSMRREHVRLSKLELDRTAAEVQCWIDQLDTARCDLLEAKG